jgi:hypothetical protein
VTASESTLRALALLKAPEGIDPIFPIAPPEKPDYQKETRGVDTFLSPKLPGRFTPAEVRRLGPEKRKARFLQAYAATMGNRSIARYYAHWTPAEFRILVDTDQVFAQAVLDTEEEIADRAKLILYSDLGMIEHIDVPVSTRKVASAVLARIVEGLHARQEQLPIDGPRKPQKARTVAFKS